MKPVTIAEERQRDGSNTNRSKFMVLYLRTSKNICEHLEAYQLGARGKEKCQSSTGWS